MGPPENGGHRRIKRDWLLIGLGVPGAIALVLFQYAPLLYNVIAFQDFQPYLGVSGSDWNGIQNFSFLWDGNQAFLNALKNTLILTLIQTVLVFPIPLVIALVLNSLAGDKLKRLLQSIFYLPHFMSWVIVVALFQQMLGNAGMLNTFLLQQGQGIIAIIGVPDLFKALLTSQIIWKDAGWGTIIFLAAISQVDQEQYEAAAVDGAGPMRRSVVDHAAGAQGPVHPAADPAARPKPVGRVSSRSSCSRVRWAWRPARCWTPGSTTTGSSAATGVCRPRSGWSRWPSGSCW